MNITFIPAQTAVEPSLQTVSFYRKRTLSLFGAPTVQVLGNEGQDVVKAGRQDKVEMEKAQEPVHPS